MKYYYLDSAANVLGPVRVEDLQALLVSGRLQPATQVCQESTENWVALSSVVSTGSPAPAALSQRPSPAASTEYVVHYEGNVGTWIKLTTTSALNAAKDFALQYPQNGDCCIVVREHGGMSSSERVFRRTNGVFSLKEREPQQIGDSLGNKNGRRLSGGIILVRGAPVWSTAFLITVAQCAAGAMFLFILAGLFAILGFFSVVFVEPKFSFVQGIVASAGIIAIGGIASLLYFGVALLLGCIAMLPVNAVLVAGFNFACGFMGGLKVRLMP